MRLKISFFHVFFIFTIAVFSQNCSFLNTSIDTIRSTYSISGKLNEIDQNNQFRMSSYGLVTRNPYLFDPLTILYDSRPFVQKTHGEIIRYSSLPHIGFTYIFGSNSNQLAKFEYTQGFKNNWILNLDFQNFKTAGILRNSGVKNQEITAKIFKQGKIVETFLQTRFNNQFFDWNGGIIGDSLALSYPLNLIPVNKDDARTEREFVTIDWGTRIKLITDSIKSAGLFIKNKFESQNRTFTETGNLAIFYPQIFLDSAKTRDHLQISTQENQLGIFYQTKNWNIQTGLTQSFWNFRNASLYRDTLEVGLIENLIYRNKQIEINQNFELNLIGHGRSWKNQIFFKTELNPWSFKANWVVENSFPDLFQRHYLANNYFYQLPEYALQLKSKIDGVVSFIKNKSIFEIQIRHVYLRNPYFFDGQTWTNQLKPQINSAQISFSSQFQMKFLYFKPSYSLCILPSTWDFYPTHLVKVRTWIQGGIFKKRKLKTFIGIEPEFIGSYSPISILPSMDLFLFNNSNQAQSGYFDFAVFTGFELNGFKFFARAENFGYFWNNRMLQVMNGYPIPPMQIQLGITWDFWN